MDQPSATTVEVELESDKTKVTLTLPDALTKAGLHGGAQRAAPRALAPLRVAPPRPMQPCRPHTACQN